MKQQKNKFNVFIMLTVFGVLLLSGCQVSKTGNADFSLSSPDAQITAGSVCTNWDCSYWIPTRCAEAVHLRSCWKYPRDCVGVIAGPEPVSSENCRGLDIAANWQDSCTDDCTLDSRKCSNDGAGLQTCIKIASFCNEWSEVTACGSGLICSGGVCTNPTQPSTSTTDSGTPASTDSASSTNSGIVVPCTDWICPTTPLCGYSCTPSPVGCTGTPLTPEPSHLNCIPPCSGWSCSGFGACVDGVQIQMCVETPAGCIGTQLTPQQPILTQHCGSAPSISSSTTSTKTVSNVIANAVVSPDYALVVPADADSKMLASAVELAGKLHINKIFTDEQLIAQDRHLTSQNLIVLGDPCTNKIAGELLGKESCDSEYYKCVAYSRIDYGGFEIVNRSDEQGSATHLVVLGTSSDLVRKAAYVLTKPTRQQVNLDSSSVTVCGTPNNKRNGGFECSSIFTALQDRCSENVLHPKLFCSLAYECTQNEVCVVKMNEPSNAHAELCSQNNYDYKVCCGVSDKTALTQDSGSLAFYLSSATNAHVDLTLDADVPGQVPVYLGANVGSISCTDVNKNGRSVAQTLAESGYDTCVASVYPETDGHIGSCNEDDSYDNLILCKYQK